MTEEEPDRIDVVLEFFRKGESGSDPPGDALTECTVESFHVMGFAGRFRDDSMLSGRDHTLVRRVTIGIERGVLTVYGGDLLPKLSGTAFTAILKAFFNHPASPRQRQYEAIRAVVVDQLPVEQAAHRFGYSVATLYSLLRDLKAGTLERLPPPVRGPHERHTPEQVRQWVVKYRHDQLSEAEISAPQIYPDRSSPKQG